MSRESKPMNEDGLNAFLDNELRQTIGLSHTGDEISDERAENLRMYLNRPVGDEEDGRSQVQSSDVQDVVEALLPGTLAPFISSDKVVEFKPVSVEDEEYAEQASLYCNHIFMVDNDGVKIQYQWQKDALLQKNGFVYADWCELEKTARKSQRVDYVGLQQLVADDEVEVIEYAGFDPMGAEIPEDVMEMLMGNEIDPMAVDGLTFEIDYRRRWKEGRVKIQNIPPEYMLVSKTAVDEETARLIGFQERVTISSLREEGYKDELIKRIELDDGREHDASGERTAREQAQGGLIEDNGSDSTDPASREVWRTVVWTRVDYDGDGKAELRKIIRGGQNQNGGVILFNEEVNEVPIITFTPIIMPHQLFGRCPADQAREIQEAKTAMLRMGMDATYHTIHPRWSYAEDLASDDTYDDLMLDIPNAPVRMRQQGAVAPLRDAPDINAAYQMLEYWDRVREIRTPVSRQDQGIQSDVLQDKTAAEATIQANATAQKKELILRLYAESLGKLFRLVNRIIIKHQDKPRLLRLYPDREPVNVDPRYWNADMDVSVNVGLGTGTKDQQLQAIMMVINEQKQLLQAPFPLVDPEKLYNAYERLIEFSGLGNTELYFNNLAAQQDQQQITPQMLKMETQKAFQAGVQQAQDQTKLAEIKSDEMLKNRELDIKERDMQLDHAVDVAEMQIRQEENRAQAMGLNV